MCVGVALREWGVDEAVCSWGFCGTQSERPSALPCAIDVEGDDKGAGEGNGSISSASIASSRSLSSGTSSARSIAAVVVDTRPRKAASMRASSRRARMRCSAHCKRAPARTVPPAQSRRVGRGRGVGLGSDARGMATLLMLLMLLLAMALASTLMWAEGKPDIVTRPGRRVSEVRRDRLQVEVLGAGRVQCPDGWRLEALALGVALLCVRRGQSEVVAVMQRRCKCLKQKIRLLGG